MQASEILLKFNIHSLCHSFCGAGVCNNVYACQSPWPPSLQYRPTATVKVIFNFEPKSKEATASSASMPCCGFYHKYKQMG